MFRHICPSLVLFTLLISLSMPRESMTQESVAREALRSMTPEDLWAVQRVGSPAISPDGKWAAFTVTAYDVDENRGNSDIYLVPTDGSSAARRLTWNEQSDSSPTWSPDGNRLAFVSKRDDNPAQLYVLPLEGGEARQITELPMGVSGLRWFPDGKRMGFVALTWPDLNDDFEAVQERLDERKESKVKVHETESRLYRYWDHYLTHGRVHHIFVVNLNDKKVRDLLPGSERQFALRGAGGGWDVSPDGQEVVFSANATSPPHQTLNYDLFVVPSSGGEPVNLTQDNPAFDFSPRYSPDGKYILYGRNDRPEIHPDYTRMALWNRKTQASHEILASWDASPTAWTFSDDGKTIYFHAQEHGKTHLYATGLRDTAPDKLLSGATLGNVDVAGTKLVYTKESIQAPAELYAAQTNGKNSLALTDFNAGLLAKLDLGRVEDLTFAGANGEEVQMFVVYPAGFDETQEWPLLNCIHGGPHGAWRDAFHYRWNAALFAAPGYVTTFVNFHGSSGSGQEFTESLLGNHAEKPFQDIMLATDFMLAKGFIDADRMACAGGSYGGYMVSWILGHTDRFACLINHAGVYDLMAQYASDYTWGRHHNYGAYPFEDPDRIDLYSPNRYAAAFETPTLILHGEKDYRVPYTQGLELHGVLTAKGVPSRLVLFPDENHWILKPQSSIRWWNEVYDWLERYAPAGGQTTEVSGVREE